MEKERISSLAPSTVFSMLLLICMEISAPDKGARMQSFISSILFFIEMSLLISSINGVVGLIVCSFMSCVVVCFLFSQIYNCR